jgi:hypothetical protein
MFISLPYAGCSASKPTFWNDESVTLRKRSDIKERVPNHSIRTTGPTAQLYNRRWCTYTRLVSTSFKLGIFPEFRRGQSIESAESLRACSMTIPWIILQKMQSAVNLANNSEIVVYIRANVSTWLDWTWLWSKVNDHNPRGGAAIGGLRLTD